MDMMAIGPVVNAGELNTQAVDWLVRSEGSGCSEKEKAALEAWLASPRNRAAFIRMRAAWSHADRLRGLQPLDGCVDPDLLKAGAAAVRGIARAQPQARRRALHYWVALMLTALVSAITAWIVALRVL